MKTINLPEYTVSRTNQCHCHCENADFAKKKGVFILFI